MRHPKYVAVFKQAQPGSTWRLCTQWRAGALLLSPRKLAKWVGKKQPSVKMEARHFAQRRWYVTWDLIKRQRYGWGPRNPHALSRPHRSWALRCLCTLGWVAEFFKPRTHRLALTYFGSGQRPRGCNTVVQAQRRKPSQRRYLACAKVGLMSSPRSLSTQLSGREGTPILWLRARIRAMVIQLLTPYAGPASEFTSTPNLCTLIAASSLTVAAALGFSRQYRHAYFIQQCLFKHFRRYLLVLNTLRLTAQLRGGVPKLRAYWAVLTNPTLELFHHPITDELLVDLGVTAAQCEKRGGLEACFDLLTEATNWAEPDRAASSAPQLQAFKKQYWGVISEDLKLRRAWVRYRLS